MSLLMLQVTFISWIPGHAASYMGADSPFPGEESWAPTKCTMVWNGLDSW